jgi:hypothetical protein
MLVVTLARVQQSGNSQADGSGSAVGNWVFRAAEVLEEEPPLEMEVVTLISYPSVVSASMERTAFNGTGGGKLS